jgi:hypothetical protein
MFSLNLIPAVLGLFKDVMSVDVVINNHCDFDIHVWNVFEGGYTNANYPDWTVFAKSQSRSPTVRPASGNVAVKLNVNPWLVDPSSEHPH